MVPELFEANVLIDPLVEHRHPEFETLLFCSCGLGSVVVLQCSSGRIRTVAGDPSRQPCCKNWNRRQAGEQSQFESELIGDPNVHCSITVCDA